MLFIKKVKTICENNLYYSIIIIIIIFILKTEPWGEYLRPRGMRMFSEEGSTTRNFIVYIVNLI